MKHRWWMGVALAAAVTTSLVARRAPHADPRDPIHAPTAVFLEGAGDGADTDVVARTPGASQPALLGRVHHTEGSARRGALLPSGDEALVVVAERPSRRASTYNSALFRVGGGVSTRLAGGLTDASSPLVTARGAVLVQRGSDGAEPALDPEHRALRERVDTLTLDRIDPTTGAIQTVWRGEGQIAFLAAALSGDEALVFHVAPSGATLFALDARSGATRALMGPTHSLMRDFSYDSAHDEIVFARAASVGSDDYEVVSIAAHGASTPRVVFRGACDHLMPRALSGGAVAINLPSDRGLAIVPYRAPDASRVAPDGDGSDAALAESTDGRWIALRHSTAQREEFTLFNRAQNQRVTVDAQGRAQEFVGFLSARSAP